MNALKIIDRANQNLIDAVKDLSEPSWTEGFATGTWTVRDIVDHIAIYEELQTEAFQKFLDPKTKTPFLDEKTKMSYGQFNEEQWGLDKNKTWQQVLDRYNQAFNKLREIVSQIPPEELSKPSTTTWYGEPASLDDVIALNYGHKKHHIAQIKLFRQRIGS